MNSKKFTLGYYIIALHQIFYGVVFAFLFILTIIDTIIELFTKTEFISANTIIIIMLIAATYGFIKLTQCGFRRFRLAKTYRLLKPHLYGGNRHSLSHLAEQMNYKHSALKKDFQHLMNRGFFSESFLNFDHDEFIVDKNYRDVTTYQTQTISFQSNGSNMPHMTMTNHQSSAPKKPAKEYVTKKCSGCGATNRFLEGSDAECEYCGSKLG